MVLADIRQFGLAAESLTPFLEIGAGGGQRSIALSSAFGAEGVATDISARSLEDAPFVLRLLSAARLPMRLCCDAHHLPFLADSFRFVFAYQTLHHFEDPVPVFAEAHRVLGRGGHLLFNEEPLDSALRRFLRGRRMLAVPRTKLQRCAERFGIAKIFWDDGAIERALGMTEARFDVGLWRECLRPFEVVALEVNRKLRLRLGPHSSPLLHTLAGVVGGNIKGVCRKTDGDVPGQDFRRQLMCVDCGAAPLTPGPQRLACDACGRSYPESNGVARVLPRELEQALHGGGG